MRTIKIVALAAAAMLAACTSQKEPAEHAVAKIEASLNDVRADAEKYAADQLKSTEASVNRLKDNLAKQDWSGVVVGAPSVAVTHEYSAYVIDFRVYRCKLLTPDNRIKKIGIHDFRWVTPAEFDDYEFPGADQATVEALLRDREG